MLMKNASLAATKLRSEMGKTRPTAKNRLQRNVLLLTWLTLLTILIMLVKSAPSQAQSSAAMGSGQVNSGTTTGTKAAPVLQAGSSTSSSTYINGDSGAYHLDWNGSSGTMLRRVLGTQPELRMPLYYLHSEPGPKGFAKYLTWFLARNNDHFDLVWCYLNDSGPEFSCWLYQYPSNQLTTFRFSGDYQFAPLPEPVPAMSLAAMQFSVQPLYTGPDFIYHDWTRRGGKLDTLALQPTQMESFASPLSGNNAGMDTQKRTGTASSTALPTGGITLSNLRVYPLHEIHVASGNGWREGGWRELHALAFDAANNPYYLILYSNVTHGYAVDLKNAQTYVADYGQKVVFSSANNVFGTKEEVLVGPPDARVARFTRMEIPLATTHKVENPFTSVTLTVDFRSPNGRYITVPAYWDGGQTWRVRFAPTQVGNWSWRSKCVEESELDEQTGSFSCIVDDKANKGFVMTKQGLTDRHAFAYADGSTFLPFFLHEPVFYFTGEAGAKVTLSGNSSPLIETGTVGTLALLIQDLTGKEAVKSPAQSPAGSDVRTSPVALKVDPPSFQSFKNRVDRAAALGFNRFWGGYLIDPVQFAQHTQANEGGSAFINGDLNAPNPLYFQWMDRRIAYCNEHGIVPDISFSDLNASVMGSLKDAQIIQLWRYVLARYASFNVNWNLFSAFGEKTYPGERDLLVEGLATVTRLYDPYNHPISTIVPNTKGVPIDKAAKIPSAPLVITPDHPGGEIPILQDDMPPSDGKFAPGSFGVPRVPGVRGNRQNPNGSYSPNQRTDRRNQDQHGQGTVRDDTEPSDDYVTSADPGVAAAARTDRRGTRPAVPTMTMPVVRYAAAPWLNVITLTGGDPGGLVFDYKLNKPLVWIDSITAVATDDIRYRLWKTLMSGAYWAAGTVSDGGAQSLDSNVTLWQVASANLFRQTNYSRLSPHQDMLGGPGETSFERRRRRRSEQENQKNAAAASPMPFTLADSAMDTKPTENLLKAASESENRILVGGKRADTEPVNPIYVLADPGWEYVVYFQHGGTVTLDLLEATGTLHYDWFNPRTGQFVRKITMSGGGFKTFNAPDTNDWVLYLSRR